MFLGRRVEIASGKGFCRADTRQFGSPANAPTGLKAWFSLCGTGSLPAATAVFQDFPAPAHLSLYLLGMPGQEQSKIFLENVASGSKLAIEPGRVPGGGWMRFDFSVPRSWRDKPVRLAFNATGPGTHSWIGFSEPLNTGPTGDIRSALLLLLRALESFALLSLAFFAVCSAAVRNDLKDPGILALLGLAGVASAGYLAFWLWFFSPKVGHLYSFLFPLSCAGYLLRWFWRAGQSRKSYLSPLLLPWLLTFASTLVVLGAGFLFGGLDTPLETAQARFSHALPMDNDLPLLFAQQTAKHKIEKPMILDWRSSDRPPLQTGLTLLQYPYLAAPRGLAYTVVAVLLQSFWLPALWAFLRLFDLSQRVVAWALAAALFSGFNLVNSFFVWPKLLAAAYAIGFCALLLSNRLALSPQKDKTVALLAGSLLAFGCLAHGGAAFAVLGLAAAIISLGRPPKLRALAPMFAMSAALYVPWMMYQKFYDPPGDRLLKLHLAGVEAVDPRPFGAVLKSAYSKLTWKQILDARRLNVLTVLDNQALYWSSLKGFVLSLPHDLTHETKSGGSFGAEQRILQFFSFLLSLGILMFGPLFLLAGLNRKYRTPLWRAAAVSWLLVFCTLAIWCALLFVPGGAVIHQGSYLTVLLAMAGSLLAVWVVSPCLAILCVSLQSALNFLLYVVYSEGVPAEGDLGRGIIHLGELLLLIGAILLTLLLLGKMAQADRVSASNSSPGL